MNISNIDYNSIPEDIITLYENFCMNILNVCVKQTTVAIIVDLENNFHLGYNSCATPQLLCPRGDMPTGEGYHLCIEVCHQTGHAEVNACKQAGPHCTYASLYLFGHTYCCDDCIKVMKEYGVSDVLITKRNTRL